MYPAQSLTRYNFQRWNWMGNMPNDENIKFSTWFWSKMKKKKQNKSYTRTYSEPHIALQTDEILGAFSCLLIHMACITLVAERNAFNCLLVGTNTRNYGYAICGCDVFCCCCCDLLPETTTSNNIRQNYPKSIAVYIKTMDFWFILCHI